MSILELYNLIDGIKEEEKSLNTTILINNTPLELKFNIIQDHNNKRYVNIDFTYPKLNKDVSIL